MDLTRGRTRTGAIRKANTPSARARAGKTHAALEAMRAAPSGLYCGPLRLLACEVRVGTCAWRRADTEQQRCRYVVMLASLKFLPYSVASHSIGMVLKCSRHSRLCHHAQVADRLAAEGLPCRLVTGQEVRTAVPPEAPPPPPPGATAGAAGASSYSSSSSSSFSSSSAASGASSSAPGTSGRGAGPKYVDDEEAGAAFGAAGGLASGPRPGHRAAPTSGDARADSGPAAAAAASEPAAVRHTACTVEMADVEGGGVDVAVLDEIQMLGDGLRGWAWTRALLGLAAREVRPAGRVCVKEHKENITRITPCVFVSVCLCFCSSFPKKPSGACGVCGGRGSGHGSEGEGSEVCVTGMRRHARLSGWPGAGRVRVGWFWDDQRSGGAHGDCPSAQTRYRRAVPPLAASTHRFMWLATPQCCRCCGRSWQSAAMSWRCGGGGVVLAVAVWVWGEWVGAPWRAGRFPISNQASNRQQGAGLWRGYTR